MEEQSPPSVWAVTECRVSLKPFFITMKKEKFIIYKHYIFTQKTVINNKLDVVLMVSINNNK